MISKFRVWDKKNKCYVKPIYEAHRGKIFEPLISMSGDLLIREYGRFAHESVLEFKDRFMVEWSTRQIDKHGVELYEGDIVRVLMRDEIDGNYPENFIIVWQKNHMRFGLRECKNGKDYPDSWAFTPNNDFEIIGKIHENKKQK